MPVSLSFMISSNSSALLVSSFSTRLNFAANNQYLYPSTFQFLQYVSRICSRLLPTFFLHSHTTTSFFFVGVLTRFSAERSSPTRNRRMEPLRRPLGSNYTPGSCSTPCSSTSRNSTKSRKTKKKSSTSASASASTSTSI